jgi:hypothetical protein
MSKILQVWKVNNYGKGVIDGSQDFFRITPDASGVTPTVSTLQEVYNQGNTINEFTEEMEEYNLSLGVFNGNEFITQESISGVVIEDTTEFTLSTQKGQNKQSLNIVSQKINEDTLSSEVGGVSVTVGKVLLIEEKSNDNGTNRVKLGFENLDEPITGTQEWEWKIPKDEPQGIRKIATREWVQENVSGGAEWGEITGTLSAQTDLQTALDLKANITALPYKQFKTSTASFTGSTSPTILDHLEIPANTLQNGKQYVFEFDYGKNNASVNIVEFHLNTSLSLSGSKLMGAFTTRSASRAAMPIRLMYLTGGVLNSRYSGGSGAISNTGADPSNNGDIETYNIDLTQPLFFMAVCINADTGTVSTLTRISIREI